MTLAVNFHHCQITPHTKPPAPLNLHGQCQVHVNWDRLQAIAPNTAFYLRNNKAKHNSRPSNSKMIFSHHHLSSQVLKVGSGSVDKMPWDSRLNLKKALQKSSLR